jgi:hypothetical protein
MAVVSQALAELPMCMAAEIFTNRILSTQNSLFSVLRQALIALP